MQFDNDFYTTVFDNVTDGVYITDQQRRIVYWNTAARRITGYREEDVRGKSCGDNLLVHINEKGVQLCPDSCPLCDTICDGRCREVDLFLRHKDGHRVPVETRILPLRDDGGQITGGVEIFTETSARKDLSRRIEELREMALSDSLTGVGNRRFGEKSLRSRLDELSRYDWPFGVVFADIDKFKNFNDRYGHETGDRVLKMVAQTLCDNVRSFDDVARWGGEEFLVILANIEPEDLANKAETLRVLAAGSSLPGPEKNLAVTVSIGATPARKDETPESLIKRADKLMYESKKAGRNCVTCSQ